MTRVKATTAADVAAAAGVSRATVSHILNGRDANFPEATKERVRQAALRLDYRPSPAGRSLVRGHSDIIVLLLPGATVGANIEPALERMSADSADLGANVVLRVADADPDRTVEGILRMRPLGVVDLGALTRANRDRLRAQGIALAADRPAHGDGIDAVNLWIARAQLDALVTQHGDTVHFATPIGKEDDFFVAHRLLALSAEAEARGMRVRRMPFSTGVPDPTALPASDPEGKRILVAAYNDLTALAVLSAASRAVPPVSVPEDLSVVGLDATAEGRLWLPQLTSVAVDIAAIVHASMRDIRRIVGVANAEAAPIGEEAVRIVTGGTSVPMGVVR